MNDSKLAGRWKEKQTRGEWLEGWKDFTQAARERNLMQTVSPKIYLHVWLFKMFSFIGFVGGETLPDYAQCY